MSEAVMVTPRPLYRDALTLAALPTAVSSARSFVVSRLMRWQLPAAVDDAVQLVEELVTSAVETTGVSDPTVKWSRLPKVELLTVTLLGFRGSLGIEVRDVDPFPAPQLSELNDPISALQGMLNRLTLRWGIAPSERGKMVWAELPLFDTATSGLPVRRPPPTPYPRKPLERTPDPELLQRVVDGLENL